ncbi:Hypothetical protein CINCED_3A004372 [Cinara cedri]|uniref:Uncharacterized protein n=1 Tax=Cinara cedri TaxID=506608 RepID=A0A5E4N7L6_9HEMI|nr:Hypothetical protein CINCED_3A004372 [Cinara cedri]
MARGGNRRNGRMTEQPCYLNLNLEGVYTYNTREQVITAVDNVSSLVNSSSIPARMFLEGPFMASLLVDETNGRAANRRHIRRYRRNGHPDGINNDGGSGNAGATVGTDNYQGDDARNIVVGGGRGDGSDVEGDVANGKGGDTGEDRGNETGRASRSLKRRRRRRGKRQKATLPMPSEIKVQNTVSGEEPSCSSETMIPTSDKVAADIPLKTSKDK